MDARICPACAHANNANARFCATCGKTLILRCNNCGRPNRLNARYCQTCGQHIVRQCPHCGAGVQFGSRVCHGCGMDPTSVQPTMTPVVLVARRYRIVRQVARGGMGVIFLVQDEQRGGSTWALKELVLDSVKREELAEAIENFRRESQLLQTLNHPNLVKVIDSFGENGKEYLVMEYVEGKTLDALANGQPMAERDVLNFAFQLCDVLEYLHCQQPPIIYRDLKPPNAMLETQSGILKLIDFGIVRFYKPGQRKDTNVLGTPGFAPPEQYGNGQTDARSDIFCLGVTMHVLLTNFDVGQNPWNYPPVRVLNSSVSPSLEQVIARATEIEVNKRYASIAEMRKALLRCKGAKRIAASLPTAGG